MGQKVLVMVETGSDMFAPICSLPAAVGESGVATHRLQARSFLRRPVILVVMVLVIVAVVVSMVVSMIMVVAVIMGVIVSVRMIVPVIMVIMVVVVTVVQVRFGVLVGLHQLLDAHLLVGRLGLLENVVDHLVLEDRRAQFDQGRRVLLVELVDHLLLPRIAARLLDQRPAELVLAHLNFGLVADLADDEAEAHSPLRDCAVLGPHVVLALALVRKGLAGLLEPLRHLPPDALELASHQRLW